MPFAQRDQPRAARAAVARSRSGSDGEQLVRDAGHRGDGDDRPFGRGADRTGADGEDEIGNTAHGRAVGERGAAELVNADRSG